MNFWLRPWLSPVRLRLSVTLVHPTQPVQIIGDVSMPFGIPWPSADIHGKFCGDRPRGIHPSGKLNARWVAKYSNFGPIEGYNISDTVQDRR